MDQIHVQPVSSLFCRFVKVPSILICVWTIVLVCSCGDTQQSKSVSQSILDPLPACLEYLDNPAGYQYCIYQNAPQLPNTVAVDKYCKQSKEWEDSCRQSWATSKIDEQPLETLIEVCEQNADCVLELLSLRPHDDVVEQIKRCSKYANRFTQDCIMHASQRWYFTGPEAEEVARVARWRSPSPNQLAFYIAARVACDGVGSCNGDQRIQKLCEKNLSLFENKKNCPNQHRKRLSK